MQFEKLYAPSLKDLFIKQLQDMILSGELEIGSRLPSERELSTQMKVSRAVVNAGMNELARQGFLRVEPRQGTYIADYRKSGNLDTLVAIMNYNNDALGKEEIRSILHLRIALERIAAEDAIIHGTTEQFEELYNYKEGLKTASSPQEAARIAFKFHHTMTLMGRNSILPLIYSSFEKPCLALWERFCRKHGIDSLYKNINALYQTLLKKDVRLAEIYIENYLQESIDGSKQIYTE